MTNNVMASGDSAKHPVGTNPTHANYQHSQQQQNNQKRILAALEQTWLKVGNLSLLAGDGERAKFSFERALLMNPLSIGALLSLGSILQEASQYLQAAELYSRAIGIMEAHATPNTPTTATPVSKGEVWAGLGFCALMLDDLPKAYNAYQQALLNLGTVLDPMIWYGIGILYDRYGSDEHALEAYGLAVKLLVKRLGAKPSVTTPKLLRDIHYRMGVLFRCRGRFDAAVKCFEFVVEDPPAGLTPNDLLLQIALVDASRKQENGAIDRAKNMLLSLKSSLGLRSSSKLLAQVQCHLAWLNSLTGEQECEAAVGVLNQVSSEDNTNPLPWYYAGRLYSRMKNPVKAYEAYQQAVYRDSRNAAYWNSVGILYLESLQYHDSLDAFSRSIQLAPYRPEIWWNLGVLYERCNQQYSDAVDAYQRATELDPGNSGFSSRLTLVRSFLAGGGENQPADKKDGRSVEPLELDPLLFLPRPTLLNGMSLPQQAPISQLPPAPSMRHGSSHVASPLYSGSVMPRIQQSVNTAPLLKRKTS